MGSSPELVEGAAALRRRGGSTRRGRAWVSRVAGSARSSLRRQFPNYTGYEGSSGTAWFFGFEQRAPSMAAFFSGDDVHPVSHGRISRRRVPGRALDVAAAGGLATFRVDRPDRPFDEVLHQAVPVPPLVDIHVDLPADADTLRAQLLTSTTREDFRRIRRANFSYRVVTDPDLVREFHSRHYAPLVAQQFPEDGRVQSVREMLHSLDQGGELICADIEGEWVAGIFNHNLASHYALMSLGIRDADNSVRQKRVVAALMIKSLERAVELERDRATLGRSLPFLGKGPVWFKSKWSGIITRAPDTRDLQMVMDLRHSSVRRMLAASPIIHVDNGALAASVWLDSGEKPLEVVQRDSGRFPGISRWYVLAEPETLAASASRLEDGDRVAPIPIGPAGDRPIWLGEVLRGSPSRV